MSEEQPDIVVQSFGAGWVDKNGNAVDAAARIDSLTTRLAEVQAENEVLVSQFDVAVQSYQARLAEVERERDAAVAFNEVVESKFYTLRSQLDRYREALDKVAAYLEEGYYTGGEDWNVLKEVVSQALQPNPDTP